ncbi:MAG: glycosyltransferase [Elusimicrobia bacterium]|nr:glycosyltransferase [Elusimicrobiota bacterium]
MHPWLGPLLSGAYLELIRRTPKLWDTLYDNQTVAQALSEFRDILSLPHRRKLRAWIEEVRPDAVVCTHALPCATLAIEKEQGLLSIPLVGVLTDFGVHAYWLSPRVERYLVPDEPVRAEMARRGIDPARARVTGIPISPRFASRPEPALARRRLGLKPGLPTVLVAGGTRGLGPLRDIVACLVRRFPKPQIVAVCGGDPELRRALRAKYAKRARVKVLGFTGDMPACLSAADILVGKAGGVTASEAAACGVPMVIFRPLPGQEERNSATLVSKGMARRVEDQEELVAALRELFARPKKLADMKAAAAALGRPDSAAAASREILSVLDRAPSP